MKKIYSLILLAVLVAACGVSPTPGLPVITATAYSTVSPPPPTATSTPTITLTTVPSATPLPVLDRFAVIGDFGSGDQAEADVATLVHGWTPDFIITVGDDNYPSGAADTIDAHIGQYYHDYISPYAGSYGPGADQNRFFPTLGNHDWYTTGAQPYLYYFSLPGNERYYDFVWGPVHFFAIDSDENEPDGVNQASVQAGWLRQTLAVQMTRMVPAGAAMVITGRPAAG